MWNFRSIVEYQKNLKNNPLIAEKLNEAQELWQLSYSSKDAVYYMLGLTVLLVLMSLSWIKEEITQISTYQAEQELLTLKLQQKPNLSLAQLGPQRLFGVPLVEQGTLALSYKLEGILYDEKVDARQVIIKDDSGETASYHVGDTLPHGGIIKGIEMDQIEIEAQGVRQKIKFPEYPASFLSDEPQNAKKSILDDAN
jgi:hypothetical protein